jgi:glycosyltransferase involved in cell wall biosynthesis
MAGGTKLGLLAYSTNTGLGIQTQEFAQHMRPERVLLVDISRLNHVKQYPQRFAGFEIVPCLGFPTRQHIARFIRALDVVFVCETPLNYDLFNMCRAAGVKTVLQPNHEFNDYYQRPHLPLPDLFALPSLWHYDDLPFGNKCYLPVPVATEKLHQHEGGQFRRFLHTVGRPAVHDRNGTRETIEAFKMLRCEEATLTIRVQGGGDEYRALAGGDGRITIDSSDLEHYWQAYQGFDCLVLPRKFGGLCLPMQEALGSGIPVIMTDVSPNDQVLPAEWLVPAVKTGAFMTRSMIDIHTADIAALTARLEWLCSLGPRSARAAFQLARALGARLSWEALEPQYRDEFGCLARA